MTVRHRQECQVYVGKTVEFVCTVGNALPDAQRRALLADPTFRQAEAAVEAACLTGDVEETKRQCRGWWKVASAYRKRPV